MCIQGIVLDSLVAVGMIQSRLLKSDVEHMKETMQNIWACRYFLFFNNMFIMLHNIKVQDVRFVTNECVSFKISNNVLPLNYKRPMFYECVGLVNKSG